MPRDVKAEIKVETICTCKTCNDEKQMTWKEMVEHLKTVHEVTLPVGAKKSNYLHLDARDYSVSAYTLEIEGGIEVTYSIRIPRKKNDPMRF